MNATRPPTDEIGPAEPITCVAKAKTWEAESWDRGYVARAAGRRGRAAGQADFLVDSHILDKGVGLLVSFGPCSTSRRSGCGFRVSGLVGPRGHRYVREG